ncbi:MAG: DM13 domain-containing protein [Paracoccaceae bacterium]
MTRIRLALAATLLAGALASPATAGENARSGSFEGANGHVTTGGVSLVETGDGHVVRLAEDFSLDGAPDPRVVLGRDGEYVEAGDLGALEAKTGAQEYAVPGDIDASTYDTVFIWCGEFSVSLGSAALE